MTHIHTREKCNYDIFRIMDGTANHHIKENNPYSERQISTFSNMWNLDLKLCVYEVHGTGEWTMRMQENPEKRGGGGKRRL